MNPIPIPKELRAEYSFLYLPSFTFSFLLYSDGHGYWTIMWLEIPKSKFYLYSIILSIIGALMFHKLFTLVFGTEGPNKNPKYPMIVVTYLIGLLFNFDAESYLERDDVEDLWDFMMTSTAERNGYSLIMGVILCIPLAFAWVSMFILPIGFFFSFYQQGSTNLVSVMLFVVLLIVPIQTRVWDWFPSYAEPENLEYAHIPEYKMYEKEIEQTSLAEYD